MSPFITAAIYVLAFLAVVALVQVLASTVFAAGEKNKRLNRRLTMLESGMRPEDVYSSLVRVTPRPNVDDARLLSLYDKVLTFCRQAGLTITPLRLLAIVAGAAAALWIVSLTFLQSRGGALLLNGATSLVGACMLSGLGAWVLVNGRRNKRLKQFEEQLPLALDIVNRAVRAGHPVVSAVQLASLELGDPIGTEFGIIVDETTYGFEFKDALINFARRTGSPDAHFFAVCIGIQSETGGNLAEILEGLASVIRGRGTLGKRVKALASEGKASAVLLSALPVGMIGMIFTTQPTYYTDKMSDPLFMPIAVLVVILYFGGWIMIQRIINFKY